MSEVAQTKEEVLKFHQKFARNFLSFPHLIQCAYGLGDQMFDEYDKLSDEDKLEVCKTAASFAYHTLVLNKKNNE